MFSQTSQKSTCSCMRKYIVNTLRGQYYDDNCTMEAFCHRYSIILIETSHHIVIVPSRPWCDVSFSSNRIQYFFFNLKMHCMKMLFASHVICLYNIVSMQEIMCSICISNSWNKRGFNIKIHVLFINFVKSCCIL